MDRVSSKVVPDLDGEKKLVAYSANRGKVNVQTVRSEEEYMENDIDEEKKVLTLPGGTQLQLAPRLSLHGGNSVHFNPEGVAQTDDEFLNLLTRERKIVAANTRFKRPLAPSGDKRAVGKQFMLHKLGRVGLDGKETYSPLTTPQAGGFKFMDTSPSPAPSVLAASPWMTWGELDATPSRLDDQGVLTPSVVSGVPAFRIPSPSKREQLGYQLADKASRQRTRDRNEAVKRVHSGSASPSARSLLSPAARRLLANSSSAFGCGPSSRPGTGSSGTSFAGSPMSKSATPRRQTLNLGVVRRPSSGRITPLCPSPAVGDTSKSSRPTTTLLAAAAASDSSPLSITDNLLNLNAAHPNQPETE